MSDDRCVWIDCVQGTDEWHFARLGMVTASRFADVMTRGTHGEPFGKVARKYALEIVAERMTGKQAFEIKAAPLKWGNDNEPSARAEFCFHHGVKVDRVGFAKSNKNDMIGCSVDGLVGEDANLEIKCPYNSTVHLETIMRGTMPKEYDWQVQGQLDVLQRDHTFFASYDPRMPALCKMLTVKVERDESKIEQLNNKLNLFIALIHELEDTIKEKKKEVI